MLFLKVESFLLNPKSRKIQEKTPKKQKKKRNKMTCYMFLYFPSGCLSMRPKPNFLASQLTSKPNTKGLSEVGSRREFGMNDLSMAGGLSFSLLTGKLEPSYLYLCSSCTYFLMKHYPKNYTSFDLRSNNNLKMPPSPPITLPYT